VGQLLVKGGVRVRRLLPIGVDQDVLLHLGIQGTGEVILQWEPVTRPSSVQLTAQCVGLCLAWVTEIRAGEDDPAEPDERRRAPLTIVWPHFQLDLYCVEAALRDAIKAVLQQLCDEGKARASTKDGIKPETPKVKVIRSKSLAGTEGPLEGGLEDDAEEEQKGSVDGSTTSSLAGSGGGDPRLKRSNSTPGRNNVGQIETHKEKEEPSRRFMVAIDAIEQRILGAREAALDDFTASIWESSFLFLESIVIWRNIELRRMAFNQWTGFVFQANEPHMVKDRSQWRLHAVANSDLDLQAWYHATFSAEVYRLRGPFWWREAILNRYGNGNKPVDTFLTLAEEQVMSSVLCSPDTSHVDVAAQIFVARELMPEDLYTQFVALLTSDVPIGVSTAVRGSGGTGAGLGKFATRKFRISFVTGRLYLTWKGKYGTQGIEINTISELRCYDEDGSGAWVIFTGLLHSEDKQLMSRSQVQSSAEGRESQNCCRLSLVCPERTIDLLFTTPEKRADFQAIFAVLTNKEKGLLTVVDKHKDPISTPRAAARRERTRRTRLSHGSFGSFEEVDGAQAEEEEEEEEEELHSYEHILHSLSKHPTKLDDGLDRLIRHAVLGADLRS